MSLPVGLPRLALAGGVALASLSAAVAPAHAIYIRSDVSVDQYNAIAQLPQYAAAASLRTYTSTTTPNPDGSSSISTSTGNCSGTLISPTKILTAAHCFYDTKTNTASKYDTLVVGFSTQVQSDYTTPTNVASVAYMPEYTSGPTAGQAVNDVAIVTLSSPVTNITPALLYAGNPTGATSAMVGYGDQGTGTANGIAGANNRLGAYNIIDVANTNVIKFDFDSPDGTSSSLGSATPLALEGSVAGGDSGSALYAKIGDNWFVVGDLNGGANPIAGRPNNFYGESNSYAPVSNAANAAFIIANAPDAKFERLSGGTSPTVVALSDQAILANISKSGSILTEDEIFEYDLQTLEVAALETSAVPEPATLTLLAGGVLAGIGLRRRRAGPA